MRNHALLQHLNAHFPLRWTRLGTSESPHLPGRPPTPGLPTAHLPHARVHTLLQRVRVRLSRRRQASARRALLAGLARQLRRALRRRRLAPRLRSRSPSVSACSVLRCVRPPRPGEAGQAELGRCLRYCRNIALRQLRCAPCSLPRQRSHTRNGSLAGIMPCAVQARRAPPPPAVCCAHSGTALICPSKAQPLPQPAVSLCQPCCALRAGNKLPQPSGSTNCLPLEAC